MYNRPMPFHHHFTIGWKYFLKHLLRLLINPIFIVITIIGNSVVLIASTLFYHLEHGTNPKMATFLDAVWLSMSTVTTVGYGDISPVTTEGKIIGIFLMIAGITVFLSYTALFAGVLLGPAMLEVETEMRRLKMDLKMLKEEVEETPSGGNHSRKKGKRS